MRYTVLGRVAAFDGQRALAVGGPQQRRLLAMLLAHRNEFLSPERLVDALWPDGESSSGATRSIHTYISRLRTALGADSIVTLGAAYALCGDETTVDADEFAALIDDAEAVDSERAIAMYDRALALWDGPAYGEFAAEWWALAEATRLEELRLMAVEQRAGALMTLGRHARVVPDLERLVADQPRRERPTILLMQALHGCNRQADALRAFMAFRARLADETGLEPSAEIVALDRAIATGQLRSAGMAGGRVVRGYVVHDVIGEGAFGRVYSARQPGTERDVAIKVMRGQLADEPEFVRRFDIEAQLVARLEHPHIVPLYDYWREPGGAYLVFRLLRGGSAAAALVNDGPWSLERVSRLIEEVGGALVAAHRAGVAHGDVRSRNVLFDDEGNAYLADFGIAERFDGTVQPHANTPSVLSDVYDLGRLLWELLAGAPPLADNGSTAAGAVLQTHASSILGVRDDISAEVDAVIGRATATDPTRRFDSVAALILAWRSAVGRPGGVLTPVGGDRQLTPESVRRRAADEMNVAVASSVNPYKGLRAFEEADAGEFFGRSELADALAELVGERRFVAVVGPSGSGKSSLVRAGLLPRLRSRRRCVIATMVPGEHPLAAMRDALTQVAVRTDDTDDLVDAPRRVAESSESELVLVVDQFEECWSLAAPDEREPFLAVLVASAAASPTLAVRVVVTIRADLYDRPLQHPDVGALVAAATFAVPAMSPAQLHEAIVAPAAALGVAVDDAVSATIIGDLSAEPASLPLLQFALAELYERRQEGRISGLALARLGGVAGAVGRRADELYEALDGPTQRVVRVLFGRLVTPGEGPPDTRRRARLSELSPDVRAVADLYVGARLLVSDRDPATHEPVLEVAHESLIASWTRFARLAGRRPPLARPTAPHRGLGGRLERRRPTRRRRLPRCPPGGRARGAGGARRRVVLARARVPRIQPGGARQGHRS